MGMFDYVRCQMPLPEPPTPPLPTTFFQTKDTEQLSGQCYLENWSITADGRLIHHKPEYLWEPNEENDGFEKYAGALKTTSVTDVVHQFHGDFCFYHRAANDEWWEYVARFTDGLCTSIRCSEHEVPAAKDLPCDVEPQDGEVG